MAVWEEIAERKRAAQAALIPLAWRLPEVPTVSAVPDARSFVRSCGILTALDLTITETIEARELLAKIASREWSAVQVATAFCKRAALTHQLTTCCTEIFFEKALQRAEELDRFQAETGRLVGPLHGLPVSVKDLFDVEGEDSSVGWAGLTGKPAPKDSVLVATLRKLGAVLYVKTNIPQSLMMSDSYNHVFGQCVSSYNRNFISGGSSGGESALIGAKGSILGIGTDIGGSVRIPSSIEGLYTLCPTIGRHPYGQKGPRQATIPPVAGPMVNHLSTIETYMEALLSTEPWKLDPQAIPIPWRSELTTVPAGKKLKIGYIIDDGIVRVQPPIERAMKEVVELLKAAGHEVIEWDASSNAHAYKMWVKGVQADGGENCKRLCDMTGEPLIEGMFVGTEKDLMTTSELHHLNMDKATYESSYLAQWTAGGIDALIMPVQPWVSFPPWTWVKSKQSVSYTAIWNLLNYAVVAMPVTKASFALDKPTDDWTSYSPRNETDEFNWKQYDIELVKDMPVGIQVVGGKFGDEKAVAVAKVIDGLLKKK